MFVGDDADESRVFVEGHESCAIKVSLEDVVSVRGDGTVLNNSSVLVRGVQFDQGASDTGSSSGRGIPTVLAYFI